MGWVIGIITALTSGLVAAGVSSGLNYWFNEKSKQKEQRFNKRWNVYIKTVNELTELNLRAAFVAESIEERIDFDGGEWDMDKIWRYVTRTHNEVKKIPPRLELIASKQKAPQYIKIIQTMSRNIDDRRNKILYVLNDSGYGKRVNKEDMIAADKEFTQSLSELTNIMCTDLNMKD